MAELLHRCWSPELARVQRLREEIGAYTTLVVGSRTPVRPEDSTPNRQHTTASTRLSRLLAAEAN